MAMERALWRMVGCLLALAAVTVAGCVPAAKGKGGAKPQANAKPAVPKPVPKPMPPPKPDVDPRAYADIPAALADMQKGCDEMNAATKAMDRDGSQKAIGTIRKATAWLALQGAAAVGPVLAETKRADVTDEYRLAAARALGDIGTPALGALQDAAFSETHLVRLKAVESLAELRPVQKSTIDLLIRLLSDEDGRVRQRAIASLDQIGEPAKDAGPKLNEILNSNAGETERDLAAKALRKVAPRRTFVN
jgi:HEAT repeat protein